MLSNESRLWVTGGVWLTAIALIVAGSTAAGASASSTAILLVLSAAPLGIALLLGVGAPAPTVAELLYAVNTRNERRS